MREREIMCVCMCVYVCECVSVRERLCVGALRQVSLAECFILSTNPVLPQY